MYVYIFISVLLFGFLTEVTVSEMALHTAIDNMISHVARSYFTVSPCAVFISEETEALTDIKLDELPIIRINVGKKSGDVDEESVQEFECLLMETLNVGCLAYVVHVENMKAMAHSFARAITRSVQRNQRNFVFLSSMNTKDLDAFAQEVLSMKELELMSNMMVAKIYTHLPVPVSLKETLTLRRKFRDDGCLEYDGAEDELLRGKKIIESLYLNFKSTKTKKDQPLLRTKLRTTVEDNTNTIIAIELVTQQFVGPNPSEGVLLDIWIQFNSEGFFTLCAYLYPDNTRDLQGKPLTAVSIPYEPFVVMDDYANPPLYEGAEFRIYRELLKKLNGTFRVLYDPDALWGAVFENGTGTGVVGTVLNGDADIGFAAIYQNWYNAWLWTNFSYPYCQSSAILVVPRPKLLPGYFVPVLLFSPGMWKAVFLSILVISVCICCLSAALHQLLPGFTKERISLVRSFLDALALIVLQVPNEGSEESRYSPWKHFMLWLSVYCLLITSVYSGGFASVLTLPRYERPINMLAEMATSDLNWMFPHEAVIWAFQDSEDPVLKTIADKYVKVSDEELAEIALNGEVGIHVEELSGGVFNYGPYITISAMSRLRLMKQPILVAHVVLNARKGAPYIQPLNKLILALNQGGIGTYWQADVVRNFMSSRLQLQIALSRTEDDPDGATPRTLQLTHVQGAFMLLGLGFIFAAVMFVIELIILRYRKSHSNCT